MDTAIGAGIEIIKAIDALISDLRSTPDFIQRINSKTQQLSGLLGALHRRSQTSTLSNADMEGWLEQQWICNTTLGKVKDLLDDYAEVTKGKIPFLGVAIFKFGPKKELSNLMEDLENSLQIFISFAGV
jgi:hypothetical protein